MTPKRSAEILSHFNCGDCQRWWSIGDADPDRHHWYCPWCGKPQQFDPIDAPNQQRTIRDFGQVKRTADIKQLGLSIGWQFPEGDIEAMFAAGRFYGSWLADGELVSAAGLFDYDEQFYMIGAVMVRPDMQGRGLGSGLMKVCMAHIDRNPAPAMLIATDEGQRLYEKFGFQVVDRNNRFLCPAERFRSRAGSPKNVRYTTEWSPDPELLFQLDEDACGLCRREVLNVLLNEAQKVVLLRNAESGKPEGYTIGIGRDEFLAVGPIIARDAEAAVDLISLLAAGEARTLRIDIPDSRPDLLMLIKDRGIEPADHPPLMMRSAAGLPYSGRVFGLMSQTFG